MTGGCFDQYVVLNYSEGWKCSFGVGSLCVASTVVVSCQLMKISALKEFVTNLLVGYTN